MKKYVLGGAVLALLGTAFAVPGRVSAHVLQTDGNIGAILHIQPDDNPLSGRPVQYTLAFSDTTGRFSLPACDCTVTARESGKAILTKSLNTAHQTASANTITFPRPDVYILEVSGKPIQPQAFQPFKLDYTVRVTAGNMQTQKMPPLLWAGMGGMIGLVLLAAYAMEARYTETANDQKKEMS